MFAQATCVTRTHDVGLQQAPARGLVPEPRDDVGARRDDALDFQLEPFLDEPAADVFGDRGLVAVGIAGLDHARDPDEIARQRDQLVWVDLRQRVAETGALSHSGDYSCGKDRITASRRMTRYSSLAM